MFLFFVMNLRPTRSTSTDTLFPYTSLFRSLRLELGGAGVYALEDGAHAQPMAQGADLILRDAAGHGLDRFVDQARTARDAPLHAAQIGGLERQISEALVGEAHGFQAAHDLRRSEERRVGKEWVSTGRSRWSRYH